MKVFFTTTIVAAYALLAPVYSADESELTPIFDGKTLEGWKLDGYGSAVYVVHQGAIRGITTPKSPNTFLLTEKEYGNFVLEFEVKVHGGLNSGVQIRSRPKVQSDLATTGRNGKPASDKDLGKLFGPQVEIEAGPGQSGYIYGEATGRGWLSPEPGEGAEHDYFKNDDWNHYRIVAEGARIQTFVNGNLVADLSDEAIYKTHPKGFIGLQVHSIKANTGPFDVFWRNLRIKELD